MVTSNIKNWVDVYPIINFISVGILLTAVVMTTIKRFETCVSVYTINSWLLSALIAVEAFAIGEVHLYLASVTTLLNKGILIPLLLRRLIRKTNYAYKVEPHISDRSRTLSRIIPGVLISVVYVALSKVMFVSAFPINVFPISVSIILLGLFLVTTRKALIRVAGLLFMETGLFLIGFALTFDMPTMRTLGILIDVLMSFIILGIFAIQVKRIFFFGYR